VLQPGKTYRVDAAKYEAAKAALLEVIPADPPGETPAALQNAMVLHLPGALFPGGEKVGWWMKCVQLDLEAKGIIARGPKAPVRLYRV
jgi:hypothetical protein